ncbi:homogentisate 1,2-dioxygenase [Desulfosediminicola flagellatus]|uniref:homogentisate 1,2-dioxygenase n=1 Tax=Desulfosediminicola flagellatus TaxID=2569541 RepID=UPI0010AD6F64|nr:homogentisate 1,2-dioxygenase [Desulfosediminicola flagellatus]
MVYYHKLGKIPPKRHTAFRQKNGSIYQEQLMGNLGFNGIKSLLYSLRPPTALKSVERIKSLHWDIDPDPTLRLRHLRPHRLQNTGASAVIDRVPLVFNNDIAVSIAKPFVEDQFFYRNGEGDEVVFVTEGEGILESQFGELDFRRGDYLVIPRGIIHRYRLTGNQNIFLVIESRGYVRTPKRYRNEHGQLLENAPFCERDIRAPALLNTRDIEGEFEIVVKSRNALQRMILTHHPFDTVGWDGFYYPWAFNISDFEPITGRIHQPPTVHQTFESDGFVICSFVPRLFDYHPDAIPAPYNHSNVGSDELLYYCCDEFMSRKGIEFGSITLHPDGMPHGPHPGKAEESIGKKSTKEEAVMIDTFKPLYVAKAALGCEDDDYQTSWLE